MQNVLVLGGSYAGNRAAQVLGKSLGGKFRVILIDRNSHANHIFVFPRFSVLPGHEHKAFIPYKGIFKPPTQHVVLQAKVVGLSPHNVTLDRAFPQLGFHSPVIPYKYAVYALGSHLPAPIDAWLRKDNAIVSPKKEPQSVAQEVEKEYTGTKKEGIEWLKGWQERIRSVDSVLVVGGGALGIQYATDIKTQYPEKQVTLLHSRDRLMPRFDYALHLEVLKTVQGFGIDVILEERLDLSTTRPEVATFNERGQRVVKTEKGREVAADLLLLCTGQIPNTELIAKMSPQSVDPKTKLAYVLPTMQLAPGPVASALANSSSVPPPTETPYPHIFVVGDSADAFGAIKSARAASAQAEVATRNVIQLIQRESGEPLNGYIKHIDKKENDKSKATSAASGDELETYTPTPPGIHMSLGIGQPGAIAMRGKVGRKEQPEPDDLGAPRVWGMFGMEDVKPEDMYD